MRLFRVSKQSGVKRLPRSNFYILRIILIQINYSMKHNGASLANPYAVSPEHRAQQIVAPVHDDKTIAKLARPLVLFKLKRLEVYAVGKIKNALFSECTACIKIFNAALPQLLIKYLDFNVAKDGPHAICTVAFKKKACGKAKSEHCNSHNKRLPKRVLVAHHE